MLTLRNSLMRQDKDRFSNKKSICQILNRSFRSRYKKQCLLWSIDFDVISWQYKYNYNTL